MSISRLVSVFAFKDLSGRINKTMSTLVKRHKDDPVLSFGAFFSPLSSLDTILVHMVAPLSLICCAGSPLTLPPSLSPFLCSFFLCWLQQYSKRSRSGSNQHQACAVPPRSFGSQ
ncbi:hypothetical protein ILYODFUR_011360 [Ilyodon furcidens]|uniref:Uncharacterized protein n=1 Tax=Ilyodon furcidens TaxID=33524 RepID=A0ABV0USU1_9TELE